jgi:hypothetical protein
MVLSLDKYFTLVYIESETTPGQKAPESLVSLLRKVSILTNLFGRRS